MIPVRDDVPSRSFPFVNIFLIVLNAVFFGLEMRIGFDRLPRFLTEAAVVPMLYTGRDLTLGLGEVVVTTLQPELGLRVFMSMFLHAGFLHFAGNMLYLWIFGDNVEDRLGHFRYVVFYLLCGWVAAYAHIWAEPGSHVPAIGASGAIAGVLGAYITLYPTARVEVAFVPLGVFFRPLPIPAVFFLGFWFLQNFVLGSLSLARGPQLGGGTAWWAHIGGFVAGATLVWLFQNPRRRPARRHTWWNNDDFTPRRRVRPIRW